AVAVYRGGTINMTTKVRTSPTATVAAMTLLWRQSAPRRKERLIGAPVGPAVQYRSAASWADGSVVTLKTSTPERTGSPFPSVTHHSSARVEPAKAKPRSISSAVLSLASTSPKIAIHASSARLG